MHIPVTQYEGHASSPHKEGCVTSCIVALDRTRELRVVTEAVTYEIKSPFITLYLTISSSYASRVVRIDES